jgi:hypothetical protein
VSLYRVTGKHRYREHDPQEIFEASLPPQVEHRALERGDIEVIEHSQPCLLNGSFQLPEGWACEPQKETK